MGENLTRADIGGWTLSLADFLWRSGLDNIRIHPSNTYAAQRTYRLGI